MPDISRMHALVAQLNRAAHAYYTLDKPIMSDHAYDILFDELLALEKETGVCLPNSPSRRVGGEILSAFRQHRHINRLWSMDKVQSKDALFAWIQKTESAYQKLHLDAPLAFSVEQKLDGLSIMLTYQNGVLVEAATRGNGEVGESVLAQVRTIMDIPLTISYQGLLEVYGEVIMRLTQLKKYNEQAEEKLKNARNAAAGALRNLDPEVTRKRRLSCYIYGVATIEEAPYQDQKGLIDFLKSNALPVCPYWNTASDFETLCSCVEEIEQMRPTLDYMIDGAVIKITSLPAQAAFGYTDRFPKWAVAYKYEAEETLTTLNAVTWEVGRTGKITPLGHIEPVEFSGVTVKKATLNNYEDIQRKNLSLGCTVYVRRSNDVIPEIIGHVEDGIEGVAIEKPTECPSCHQALTETGAHLYCTNRTGCKEQAVMRLSHFASRNAMDIAAFSKKTAERLFDALGVSEVSHLYQLTGDELRRLDGFGDKKADNLISAIEQSKQCRLENFIFALGIFGIGKVTAKALAAAFGTIERLRQATIEELTQIDEVGDVLAGNVVRYFADAHEQDVLETLLSCGVTPAPVVKTERNIQTLFSGRTFVVTGMLAAMGRQEAEEKIQSLGGHVVSSVSKKTNVLICGQNAGSKLQKAQDLQIPIWDETEFITQLHEAEQTEGVRL